MASNSIYADRVLRADTRRKYTRKPYRVPLLQMPVCVYSADYNHRYLIYVYNPYYPRYIYSGGRSIARHEISSDHTRRYRFPKPMPVRCYDNGGKTLDRYIVVYTEPWYLQAIPVYNDVCMSGNPTAPCGICMVNNSADRLIDHPGSISADVSASRIYQTHAEP